MKKIILSLSAMLMVIVAEAETLKPVAQKISERKAEQATFRQAQLFEMSTGSFIKSGNLAGVKNASVFEFYQGRANEIVTSKPENLSFIIPISFTENLELELYRANIFTPDFTVVTSGTNGEVFNYEGGVHYWGIIKGDNASIAAISIFNDEVMGMISSPTKGNFVLGKIENDPVIRHILYNDRDLDATPPTQCYTMNDQETYTSKQLQNANLKVAANCIRLYWEVDFDIYQNKGSVTNATNYVTGLFNQSAIIYTNDNIPVSLSQVFVWNTTDPYTSTSTSGLLGQFQSNRNSFNGDLGNLLGYAGGGGVAAGFSGFCASNLDNSMCYSGISSGYSNVPTFSWSVEVVTHEQGHLMGSRHTHACVWNGNNTAIDNCGPNAGYGYEGSCSGAPTPVNGGTIMSYCHLTVGINFSNGFGTQPKNVILNAFNNAGCLSSCTGGCGTPYALSASSVTVSSATVSWGFITGALSYNLQYKKTALTTWTTITGITSTSSNLTGLSDATSYDYQVQAVCSSATSVYSPVSNFTTVTICTDAYEPNNTNATAPLVPVNTNLAGLITPQGDVDIYKFKNTASQRNIMVTLTGLPADYDLKLLKNGVQLAVSAHGGTTSETIVYNTTSAAGPYVIKVYGSGGANNANACYTLRAQISATAFRAGDPDQSISNAGENESGISIYPNPANDVLNVDIPAIENNTAQISVIDQTGREISGLDAGQSKTPGHVQLDISKFSNGIYFVRVIRGENAVTQKLVVNH